MRILAVFALFLVLGCSPLRNSADPLQRMVEKSGGTQGIYIQELETGKVLFSERADSYFTPASTVKLFTFFLVDQVIGREAAPWLEYQESGDSLWIWGTGHPGYMYGASYGSDDFPRIFSTKPHAFFCASNNENSRYGPGWAWDDEAYLFQKRISPLPLAGNEVTLRWRGTDLLEMSPLSPYFPNQLPPTAETKTDVLPIDEELLLGHLNDRFSNNWQSGCPENLDTQKSVLQSVIPLDSLLKQMLQTSDNFLAEQLLALSSHQNLKVQNNRTFLEQASTTLLPASALPYQLFDGSGLSRYNKLTPKQVGNLLAELWKTTDQTRLLHLLAQNGKTGSLQAWKNNDEPFFYGKTGSMRGVYCLSGYLKTKSGKWLSISILNNSFTGNGTDITREVRGFCESIRDKY